jgi:hypothetical protein
LATNIKELRRGALILLAFTVMISLPFPAAAQTADDSAAGKSAAADRSGSADPEARDDTSGAGFLGIGAGIGSPSGITVIVSACYAPIVVRVSGGYWGASWNGVQGDIGFLFNSSPYFAHGISFIGGVFRTNPLLPNERGAPAEADKRVRYFGAAYDVYLSGFYLQVGLARGQGDYPNPQLAMQFGYLFAF